MSSTNRNLTSSNSLALCCQLSWWKVCTTDCKLRPEIPFLGNPLWKGNLLLPTPKVTFGQCNDLMLHLTPTVFALHLSFMSVIHLSSWRNVPSIQVSWPPPPHSSQINHWSTLEYQDLICVHMCRRQKTALVFSTLFLRQGFSVATEAQLAGQQGSGILLSVSSSPVVRLQTHIHHHPHPHISDFYMDSDDQTQVHKHFMTGLSYPQLILFF